jgi:hypothetical protein
MRRATVRTTHDDPETVAAAVAPDNTDEMATDVDGDAVETRIERPSTGGLAATVDDYVVNLIVADRVAESAEAQPDDRTGDTHDT